jgi:predicted DNA-binding protein
MKQKSQPTSFRFDTQTRQSLDYLTEMTGLKRAQIVKLAVNKLHRDFVSGAVTQLKGDK